MSFISTCSLMSLIKDRSLGLASELPIWICAGNLRRMSSPRKRTEEVEAWLALSVTVLAPAAAMLCVASTPPRTVGWPTAWLRDVSSPGPLNGSCTRGAVLARRTPPSRENGLVCELAISCCLYLYGVPFAGMLDCAAGIEFALTMLSPRPTAGLGAGVCLAGVFDLRPLFVPGFQLCLCGMVAL